MPTDPTSRPQAPRLGVPADACDCHVHVLDSAYPPAPTAAFIPPEAPLSAYRAVQQVKLPRLFLKGHLGEDFSDKRVE